MGGKGWSLPLLSNACYSRNLRSVSAQAETVGLYCVRLSASIVVTSTTFCPGSGKVELVGRWPFSVLGPEEKLHSATRSEFK